MFIRLFVRCSLPFMELSLEDARYEPLPRWGHISVAIGNKIYMWGGRIEDFSDDSKKQVSIGRNAYTLSFQQKVYSNLAWNGRQKTTL